MKGNADYICSRKPGPENEAVILESVSGEEFVFKVPLPGEHNALNATFAIAVARQREMG